MGIHHSRSVTLSKIAGKIPGKAKLLSSVRRLGRFLSNPAIRVQDWYEPIARQWLAAQFRHLGEIRLVVDGTKIGSRHQLLIVCLTYRKRAIPVAWTWVKHARGHSTSRKQLALLAYVRHLIPLEAGVSLRVIQACLGHSSIKTTTIYTHLTRKTEVQAIEAIDQVLDQMEW